MGEIINRCPICGMLPPLNLKNALTGKHFVGCMNICCNNFKHFESDSLGEAMAEWNMWAHKEKSKNGFTTKHES